MNDFNDVLFWLMISVGAVFLFAILANIIASGLRDLGKDLDGLSIGWKVFIVLVFVIIAVLFVAYSIGRYIPN